MQSIVVRGDLTILAPNKKYLSIAGFGINPERSIKVEIRGRKVLSFGDIEQIADMFNSRYEAGNFQNF
jgi:hypothetical protein